MANPSGMAMLRSMVATSALYNGKRDKKDDYTDVCHPGTREKHLNDLATWADNGPADERLQWASAIAGAGKTAMMRTFCHLLEKKVGAFASFFIWQSDPKRNTLTHFPATVAYQLSRRITALVPRIERAFEEDPLVLETSFENQMEQLIVKPLLDVKVEHHLIIVVDGLDELDATSQTEFLSFIPHFLSQLSSFPISVLVSSRPDAEIVAAFKHPRLVSITRATRLGASDDDIWKFLSDKFDDINLRYPDLQIECGGQWPSHVKRAIMVLQSSGLFIWPTVAINYIDKVALGLGHNKRLEQVLASAEPKPWIASPLDNLYRAILQAHAPQDPGELLRFKQRLAYLCLSVGLDRFVGEFRGQVSDWSDTPFRAVFDETLGELWDSVAGLSSLFLPRTTLSKGKSPAPGISHRSLRDFTFNRARCGDKLYYSSEQELHAEVVYKAIKFFNTRQVYQDCADMSAKFISYVGAFLRSHLKAAAVSEELGHCMDDVMLDYIPPTWPLVTQMFLVVELFEDLYKLADNPDFIDGSQRRKAFLSKLVAFFKSRAAISEGWDIALFRLTFSTANLNRGGNYYHSVHCWHISRSVQCACLDARIRGVTILDYQYVLLHSTIIQHAKSRLLPDRQDDVARDSLVVLQFVLSLSGTSRRATELSSFISIRIDHWIIDLLQHCPPNDDLYDALGPICTAPLPDLPRREGDSSSELVEQFLKQTEAFNEYTERCRKVGIETSFPPIRIPDDWWEDEDTRNNLLGHGYNPPFDIPDEWWEDEDTRKKLLGHGYSPPFDIPDDLWEDERTRDALLDQGYKPPFDIPNEWWNDKDTRQLLRSRGYPPPNPYSAEKIASKSGSDAFEDEEPDAGADHLVSGEEEPLAGGEALSGIALPQVLPLPGATSSNPLPIQQPVATDHPMTTPAAGVENGQIVPLNVGGRRRRLRDSLKDFFRR